MSPDERAPKTNTNQTPPDLYVRSLASADPADKSLMPETQDAPDDTRNKRKKKKKKKAECMRIGPVFRNDPKVREDGQPYAFRACSPFVCPHTLRLLHGNVPSVNYARYAAQYETSPGSLDIPPWAHSQRPEWRDMAARLGREYTDRRAMVKRWAPCITNTCVTDDDFWCAVFRMEWLEGLRNCLESEPEATRMPRDAILQVALLQDMNQMRLLMMDSHGKYNRKECVAIVGETAYELHYGTSLATVMHFGMLPDLSSIYLKLPYWDKPTETFVRMSVPFDHDELANAFVRLATKIIFQPSKMRELNKCIYEEISRMLLRFTEQEAEEVVRRQLEPNYVPPPPRASPAYRFMLIIQRLVFCSLGGYYPHSKYIPSAVMRRELYRRYSFDVMSLSEFKMWVIQNKRLLTMVLRENLIFNLHNIGGLESIFYGLYEYENIKNKTLHAMETTRKAIDTNLAGVLASMRSHIDSAGYVSQYRPVWREHFPLRCAMLSNVGDVLWAFTVQYGSPGHPPAVHHILSEMFWKSTPLTKPYAIRERFCIMADEPLDTVQARLRMIVLYWLIMKDRCSDQSMKKSHEKYALCKRRIARDGMYLLPGFPEGKRAKRTGGRRDKTSVACDSVVLAEAADAEAYLTSVLVCIAHNCPVKQCTCLANLVLDTVDEFNIYRYMQPEQWGRGEVSVGGGIEHYMWQMYDACLGWCYRPRQTTFAEEIATSAATVCNVFTTPESLATELRKPLSDEMRNDFIAFHRTHAEFKLVRDRMYAYMTDVVNSHPPDWGISFEWLSTQYGVTNESLLCMDEAHSAMMGESHHKMPYNALLWIARVEPRDFWIIRLLYKIIYRRESIRVYPLWREIAQQQIQAIHEQSNAVPQGEQLPDPLGRVHYCPAHRRILSPIVGADLGPRGHNNTFAVDAEKIVIDPLTRVKYCGVRTGRIKRRCVQSASDTTKLEDQDPNELIDNLPRGLRRIFTHGPDAAALPDLDDEEYDEPEEDANASGHSDGEASRDGPPRAAGVAAGRKKGARKRRTKKKNYTRCGIVPAESVNMVGVMLMLYNALYMLCPYCGHVMRYGRDKCTEIGLWCGACIRGEKALSKKLGVSWDELNQCADPDLILGNICGVPVAKTPTSVCYYCGTLPPANRPLKYHLMFNDLTIPGGPPRGLVYLGFCDNHAKWWIGKDATTMRVSVALHNFRIQDAARHSVDPDEMRRVIPRTYSTDDGSEAVMISLPFEGLLSQFRDDAVAMQHAEKAQRDEASRRRKTHNAVKRALKPHQKGKKAAK